MEEGRTHPLILAVDMDGVLANLIAFTVQRAQEEGFLSFQEDHVKSHAFLSDPDMNPQLKKFIRKLWGQKSTWEQLPPHPLVAALRELQNDPNIELLIVTSPWSTDGSLGMCIDAKREWLNAQDLVPRGIFFTARPLGVFSQANADRGLPSKHLVKADIFIDDHPDICAVFAKEHPLSHVLMPARPWNAEAISSGNLKRLSDEALIEELQRLVKNHDVLQPVRYRFRNENIFIERADRRLADRWHVMWKVLSGGWVLNSSGEWEYEPMPSSRDDEFLTRTRFSISEAFDRASRWYEKANDEARWAFSP